MGKIVEVRKVRIGEGKSKICVSLMGRDEEALEKEISCLEEVTIDVIEWRLDYYEAAEEVEQVVRCAKRLRSILGEKVLLATFRTKGEGGEREISVEDYIALNKRLVQTQLIDLIDLELFTLGDQMAELVTWVHQYQVKVVMSNHDFQKTPTQEEIVARLCRMQKLGADIPKIAVMPRGVGDVITLLSATYEMVQNNAMTPIITMAMGKIGVISRLSGEVFGSALTFAAVGAESAPGQLSVDKVEGVLNLLHDVYK